MVKVSSVDWLRRLDDGRQQRVYTVPADGQLRMIAVGEGEHTLAVETGESTGEWLVHRGKEPDEAWVTAAMDRLRSTGQANAPLTIDPLTVTGDGEMYVYLRGQTATMNLVIG